MSQVVSTSTPAATPVDTNIGRVMGNRYLIEKKIGSGAFGTIYIGKDMITNQKLAIKVEPGNLKHPQLEYEARVYQLLAGSPNIPAYYAFFQEDDCCMLAMDLLGPSLEDLFNYCHRRFSLKTVLMLGDQMIQRIEYLHYKHFIHRDIKPDNFVVGLDDQVSRVFLIDFGLAKRYRRPGSLVHIPFRDKKNLTGTARYASINTHKGCEQSRRDDLESLGYVLIYFLLGHLPWQGLRANNKNDKYGRIYERKLATSPETLCRDLPPEFVTYFHHVRNLRFDERPDYDYLRRLLRNVMQRENYRRDFIYDWTLLKMEQDKNPSALDPAQPPPFLLTPNVARPAGVPTILQNPMHAQSQPQSSVNPEPLKSGDQKTLPFVSSKGMTAFRPIHPATPAGAESTRAVLGTPNLNNSEKQDLSGSWKDGKNIINLEDRDDEKVQEQ